jgi:hypothetical protein
MKGCRVRRCAGDPAVAAICDLYDRTKERLTQNEVERIRL